MGIEKKFKRHNRYLTLTHQFTSLPVLGIKKYNQQLSNQFFQFEETSKISLEMIEESEDLTPYSRIMK